jgi:hypothetical protein
MDTSNITTYIVVGAALILILVLVYLKTCKFELFYNSTSYQTIPIIANNQNNNILDFINKYIKKQNQQSKYQNLLLNQQNIINDYSNQVTELINPS